MFSLYPPPLGEGKGEGEVRARLNPSPQPSPKGRGSKNHRLKSMLHTTMPAIPDDWPSRLIKPERPASNNAGILTLRIANVVFASFLAEPAYAVGGASAGCFLP
jgi:hypothetical protein